jgi:prepilin-type N-terminal cleavage/methylation domain-containing protein
MSGSRGGRGSSGLTLIELVLALAILAVAGALVSGAFTGALRSWSAGLAAGREELVARVALERIATQLRAAVGSPARRGEQDAVAFDAGDEHLRFVTAAGEGAAPAHVFYGLADCPEGRCLVYREHPWPDKDFFGASRPRREELIAEIAGLAVRVEPRDADAGEDSAPAAREWDPAGREMPGRVTVEIRMRGEGGRGARSWRAVVPILAGSAP